MGLISPARLQAPPGPQESGDPDPKGQGGHLGARDCPRPQSVHLGAVSTVGRPGGVRATGAIRGENKPEIVPVIAGPDSVTQWNGH